MSAALLELDALDARLGGRLVLGGVTARFGRGEFIALVGPNGSGKSTLLRALAGLIPHGGALTLDGRPLATLTRSERARAIAYLPQGHTTHWSLPVREIVALGRMPHGASDPRRLSPADAEIVADAMQRTGVGSFADRPATRLSGGEKARVALARVLAQQTPVLLADEPTAWLDPRFQIDIMALLRSIARSGALVIAATHDLAQAVRFADRIWVLHAGQAMPPAAPADALTPGILARVFRIRAADRAAGLAAWEAAP